MTCSTFIDVCKLGSVVDYGIRATFLAEQKAIEIILLIAFFIFPGGGVRGARMTPIF
jgi:hypothetical protein